MLCREIGEILLICYEYESISNCERARSQFANQEKKDRIACNTTSFVHCIPFLILLLVIFILEECPGTAIVGDAVALVIGCITGYTCIFYTFSYKFNKNVEDGQILMAENCINGSIF